MTAFVGRGDELAALTRAVAQSPVLVLIEGEAGIGKTRLVQECGWSGGWAERTVLMLECQPVAQSAPLGAVVDGLRRLRDGVCGVELSPLAGALRPLFPEWAVDLPPLPEPLEEAGARRHRLFRALTELVDRLGVELLVVEDAHWADEASLEWLNAACGSGHARSVVVTYRREDVPSGSPLWQLTAWRPPRMGKLHIELEPLNVSGVQQLAEATFRRTSVSMEFAEFLHQRTGGLPLAVVECMKLLRDRGDIMRKGGGWGRKDLAEIRVPPTVRDLVLERVGRIGRQQPAVRRLLEAAAVLRDPAGEPLLGAVAGLAPDATRSAVAGALASGLLVGSGVGQFVFRHVLDLQAVEEAVPVSERRRMHARAGQALQRLAHPPVVRLARHLRQAGQIEQWSRYAEAAAELARESGDDRTAVSLLLDLLTAAPHPAEQRVRIASKLGEAAVWGTAPLRELGDGVRHALQEVLAGEDLAGEDRGRLRLLMARFLSGMSEHEAAFAAYETAIAELAGRPALATPAMLNLAWPLMTNHPASWHRGWLDRATELLPRIESRWERLWFTGTRATVLGLLGEEACWQVAGQLPASAPTRAERQELATTEVNLAQVATVWGRYPDARRRLASGRELLQAIGYRRQLDVARIAQAHLDWYTGAWDGLAGTVEELAATPEAHPTTRLEARLIQALLALTGGARASAEQHLRQVSAGLARIAHGGPFILPSAGLARMHLADGAADRAVAVTDPDIAMIAGKGVWLWATDVAPVHVAALTGTGQLPRAESVVETFAAGIEGRHAPAPAAALATCRATLAAAGGDPRRAAALFAAAAAAWAALPRPYDELLALEQQGCCLLAAGQEEAGLSLLHAGQQRLWQLGARWDADRLARLLRQHDIQVARTWRRGRRGYGDQLSPRELQVVELVAQGLTNKQIADSLFISAQTVRRHLYKSMRKLAVSSRTALAMGAAEAGLLSPDGDR